MKVKNGEYVIYLKFRRTDNERRRREAAAGPEVRIVLGPDIGEDLGLRDIIQGEREV